jgi:isopenicillin-N N-acyltransferase-like protein
MRLLFGGIITLFLAVAGCAMPAASPPSADPPIAPPSAAAPAETFPTPILELTGSPAEIGKTHGERLAKPIKLLSDQYMSTLLGNGAVRAIATFAARGFESRLLPEHREELVALAKACGLDFDTALLGQCFLDLGASEGCSTVTLPASASPDHIARFGRNLDFFSLGLADKYSTVFVYHPQGRFAFVAIGWPGQIGVLSGMNQWGLTLANMEVPRELRLPDAMPYMLLYRMVLERCKTVNEAIALLKTTPRQSANNLMLMDASGARAVAEISPAGVVVRRADANTALISTNNQRGQDADSPGICPRYDSLHDNSKQQFGAIGVKQLEGMLAAAEQKNFTLQSMIFEPSTRTLYLATGLNAAERPFYKLDLEPYFDRAAPAFSSK